MKYKFGLCEGRHPMPVETYVFPGVVDPTDVAALTETALKAIPDDATEVVLFVSGLTAAFAAVVAACHRRMVNLTAMHYDRSTGQWREQPVISQFTGCPYNSARRIYPAGRGVTCSPCGACS